ncbi:MAG TPA: TolC family protein [Ignavibacteriales bacterium]|nr:TolC family protein [Ignavibacteriales bacterium]
MLKIIGIFLFIPLMLFGQEVKNIGTLFDSLKTHSQSKSDEINVEQAGTGKSIAYSHLFPNIDVFGRYDYYSKATGVLPLPPNEMFTLIRDPSLTQPFSQIVYRIGAAVSMPIFVKSIFTMASKTSMIYKSAKYKKYINMLKNEAMIVSLNSSLAYIEALGIALEQKKNSLLKTKEFITIKVKNGRTPESSLLKINNGVTEIDVMENDLSLQREEVLAGIRTLTGVSLKNSIPMTQTGNYKDGEIKALDPLKEKLEADRLGHRAEVEKLFPILALQGNFNRGFATAYNNNKGIAENYYTIGLVLKIPLLAMDQYAQISRSTVEVKASENELDKASLELSSQAAQLKRSLPLIENSIALYKSSIDDKEELLKIAKVSYQSDQMTMEDYLKYEDDLVLEKSKLFKAQSQKWQTLVKLAVIYGNSIEEIIK